MLNAEIEDLIKRAVREAVREELAGVKLLLEHPMMVVDNSDKLLTAVEAAKLLSCSKESVYKMAFPKGCSARVQLGPGMVRWSFNGLQKEIQRRMKK